MFNKILIANRGEIALRVMRSCREMSIKTVAVYSQADKDMPYVNAADEAYFIGGARPEESYLNIAKIIEVAKFSGAEAIHPGYGFLSQNPLFASACKDAGIVFIGPSPEMIKGMGNKLNALKIAGKAGVPTLNRSKHVIRRGKKESEKKYATRVKKIAQNIGFPLMVKPQGGGGGIGMKVVQSENELLRVVESSRAQAGASFGDPEVYLEQYLPNASHIEVQILADGSGRILHFFERDCSIQRRNQKIIEESPTEKLDEEQRKRIQSYAVKIVKRARKVLKTPYIGVGTLEFLADAEGSVYFIEMNTRLQVEHGVSELVTGIDIVEWQIRVAAGENLSLRQRRVKARGHAIEVRVYPEAWSFGSFIPQIGKIKLVSAPCAINTADGNVRIDSALDVGEVYEIPIDYEPLIMKVICKGKDKGEARALLLETLERIVFEGAETNLDLLKSIVAMPVFQNSKYTTQFFGENAIFNELNNNITVLRLWNNIGSLCLERVSVD